MVCEAGIVNYYSRRGFMGGHKDDLEYTFTAPVVSISLGCACVFLLGGEDAGVEPVSVLLKSGDVMVMGGDARLAMHGEDTRSHTHTFTCLRWYVCRCIEICVCACWFFGLLMNFAVPRGKRCCMCVCVQASRKCLKTPRRQNCSVGVRRQRGLRLGE